MWSLVFLIIGFVFLIKGANFLVDGAASIARLFRVSELVIGLTVVAFGTSTPELFVNILAGIKGNTDIAVGNIVGSNIFNIFFILGVSSLIRPLPFPESANVDALVMIAASVVLFLTMFTGKKQVLERWEGVLLLLGYFAYTAFLLVWR
jgi:cation:H+ antiporter